MLDDRREFPLSEPLYAGMRISTDEYERLEDDGHRYEVIDGVVVMAPSPTGDHQDIAGEIEKQLRVFLDKHPVGRVFHDMDVRFTKKTLYQPDLTFVSKARLPKRTQRVHVVPEMVLEVLSPGTRRRDLSTKKDDYERFGITEYWLVDPQEQAFTCLRLKVARLMPVTITGRWFASEAIPGFKLDLTSLRRVLRGD
jgi:Uma2 family endonuclease